VKEKNNNRVGQQRNEVVLCYVYESNLGYLGYVGLEEMPGMENLSGS